MGSSESAAPQPRSEQQLQSGWRIADLAKRDERWERLLSDPDGIFTGEETVEDAYYQYLTEVLGVMERYECTFREAVSLSDTDAAKTGHDVGVADYLKARRSGWPAYRALVYNLRALKLGPCRAELCASRRNEARSALERGRLVAEAAEDSLAKGISCSAKELAEVDETLLEAKQLCFGLDQALEILQANSVACGDGEDVMAEYEELFNESATCNAKLYALSNLSVQMRKRHWRLVASAGRLISNAGQVLWPACLPCSMMFITTNRQQRTKQEAFARLRKQ